MKNGSLSPIAIAISLAITTLFLAMFLLTPFCFDDYLFCFYWNEAHHDVFSYISIIRFEENGRIGNILFPIFDNTLCWPFWKTLFALTTSTTILTMGALCRKSTGANSAASMACVFLLSTLLPWRARLFVSDYFLNYIPGSLMAIALVGLYVYPPRRNYAVWGVLLAFFTGLQHEALTLSLAAGILALFIINRFRFSARQWLMTVALFAAGALQLSSPGLWLKFNAWTSYTSLSSLLQYFPLIIILILSLPLLFIRKCRPLTHNQLFIVSTAIALTAPLLIIPLGVTNARATWFQQIFAVISISQIYLILLNPSKWLGLVVAALCTAYWCAIITLQHRFYITNQAIETQFTATKHLVYAELPQKKPKWALFIPQQSIWSEPTQITMANLGDTTLPKAVVPPQLREINPSELHPVPGTAGAVEFRGIYLMPHRRTLLRIDGHGHPVADVIEASHLNLFTETDTFTETPVSLQNIHLPGLGNSYNLIRPAHYHFENRYYTRIDTIK